MESRLRGNDAAQAYHNGMAETPVQSRCFLFKHLHSKSGGGRKPPAGLLRPGEFKPPPRPRPAPSARRVCTAASRYACAGGSPPFYCWRMQLKAIERQGKYPARLQERWIGRVRPRFAQTLRRKHRVIKKTIAAQATAAGPSGNLRELAGPEAGGGGGRYAASLIICGKSGKRLRRAGRQSESSART